MSSVRGLARRFRPAVAVITSVTLGMLLVLVAPPAGAASDYEVGIKITPTSSTTQESGKPFTYDLDFNCDYLGGPVGGGESTDCEDTKITMPLGDLAGLPLTDAELKAVIKLSPDADFDIVDGKLVIDLGDVPSGESTQFQLTITPPNFVTPNGTSWSLLPTVTGSNLDDTTAPAPANGKATATLNHTINKSVVGSAFRDPGDTVDYTIQVACSQKSTGTILADSMHVTDVLPADLHYISSLPAGSVSGSTLSWNLSGADVPTSCSDPNGNGTATFQVKATVDPDADYGTAISNTAGVTSHTTDGQDIAEKTSTASITIVGNGQYPVGTFGKDSFAQLRDRDADPSTSSTGLEPQSHTTYSGNWMGVLPAQSGNVLSGYVPNQASGMRQAGYKMQYSSPAAQGAGFQMDLTDPVPCLDNKTNEIYSSNAVDDLCQNPAFHVTTASVWSDSAGGVPSITVGYVPHVVYADGTTADMVKTSGGGANFLNFVIPDTSRTDVAEIVFPRDAGLSGPKVRWAVFGYVDNAVGNAQIVKDRSTADVYWKNETDIRKTVSDDADIYVINAPQIGIEKDLGAHNASGTDKTSLKLTSRLIANGAVNHDLVVTDLLPTGMVLNSPPSTVPAIVTHLGSDGVKAASDTVNGSLEVLDNWQGTGRQLVRITVPKGDLSSFGSLKLEMSAALTVSYVHEPGTYNNTAEVYYTSDALLSTCQQDPAYQQNADETYDLNGNGTTSDANCYSKDSLTIPPPTGGAAFKVTKTVQGDEDAAPKSYPGIGLVGTDGGGVNFGIGWKNTGGSPLKGAVVYDIFPRIGDVGVGGSVAGKPRNSAFDATFVDTGAIPANVEVAYTTATNPCRPEVFSAADNLGCVNDWTTTEPTNKTTITGIRLVSSATYQPGAGFDFIVRMTVPAIDEGQIAWNSVAGAAVNANTGNALNPNSPPKVGITATSAGLPLLLAKELDSSIDPAKVQVGDTLTYRLSISNPDLVNRTLDATDKLPAGLQYVSVTGEADSVTDTFNYDSDDEDATTSHVSYDSGTHSIVWDAQPVKSGQTLAWIVKVKVAPGISGDIVNHFSSPDGTGTANLCPDDPDQECVGVTVNPAELTISKAVDGAGSSFAQGPYTAHLLCTAGVQTVVDQDVELAADGSDKTVAVPYGSSCQVTETDDGGATGTVIAPTGPIDIVNGTATYNVSITNTFETGQLVIKKLLGGQGTSFAGGSFAFGVKCTFDGRTVFDDNVTVPHPEGSTSLTSNPVSPLPIGAACVVTETDNGGADTTPAPVTVTIATNNDANTVNATFTNEYSAGTVSVEKVLEGAGATQRYATDAVFTVSVVCALGNENNVLYSGLVKVKGGDKVDVLDAAGDPLLVPLGTHCWANETEDGGATGHKTNADSYADALVVADGSPNDLQPLSLVATNTFDLASVTLEKIVDGTAAHYAAGRRYVLGVSCVLPQNGVLTPLLTNQAHSVEAGKPVVVDSLPVGAQCWAVETDSGGATSSAVDFDSQTNPASVTADGTAKITATNTFDAGSLKVTKKVVHGGPGPYSFELACTTARGKVNLAAADAHFKLKSDESRTINVPVGADCSVKEVDVPAKADVSYKDSDGTNDGEVIVAGNASVTVTNTFDPGLPDTGGPGIGWSLAALLLLATGGGLIFASRRRSWTE